MDNWISSVTSGYSEKASMSRRPKSSSTSRQLPALDALCNAGAAFLGSSLVIAALLAFSIMLVISCVTDFLTTLVNGAWMHPNESEEQMKRLQQSDNVATVMLYIALLPAALIADSFIVLTKGKSERWTESLFCLIKMRYAKLKRKSDKNKQPVAH